MLSRKKRNSVLRARARVLNEARRIGFITNAKARKIGGWSQAWYHLDKLAEAGLLERADRNTWAAVRRRGRQVRAIEQVAELSGL
jgi:hypothetical protein